MNFAHNLGYWKKTTGYTAFVYDPVKEELFFAETERGAYLNEKRIKISEESLSSSLIVIGWSYGEKRKISLKAR